MVEIDYEVTGLFLHKACFNTSRLTVDSIKSGEEYDKIKKIFHINIIYFKLVGTEAVVQHGRTEFHHLDHRSKTILPLSKESSDWYRFNDILPEYFIISLPGFDNVVKEELDAWLYVLKNTEVPKSYQSSVMNKVAERLNILKMPDRELAKYRRFMSEKWKHRDYIAAAMEEGIEKGIEKGEARGRAGVAREMKKQGLSIEQIAACTKLSLEEIEKL